METGRQQIMTIVKMLIIIFMHDSSVILSDDPITMSVYFRTKVLISHKKYFDNNFTPVGLELVTWQVPWLILQ